MRAVALLAVLAGCHAHAGATVAYDLSYRRAFDADAAVGGVATAGTKGRMFAGANRFGPAFGLDLALGGSHPGGVAWRGAAYPLGVGTTLGRHGVAGAVVGFGGSGVTGHVPGALELPAELFGTVRLGDRTAISAWIQPAWLPFSETRDAGAPDLAFVDEVRAGLTVRIGRAGQRWRVRGGDGYHLGAIYSEELGARFVGVTVGYDVDVSAR